MQCRDSHVAHRGKEVKQASPMILHPDTHTRARARDYICTYMYKYLITTRPVAPSTPTLGRLPRPRHSQGPASEDLPPTPTPLYKMGRWVQPGKADRLGAPGPFLQRSKSKPKPISLELQLLGLEPLRSEVLASPYPRSPPGIMRCAPTASAALVLCAATAGLLSVQGRPAQPEPPRFASWDEMNLLAHGLLQLGHGLREHVERTRGQLGALERRMTACGNACQGPQGKDAPSKDPEGRVPDSEAASETLQSLQVGALTRGNRAGRDLKESACERMAGGGEYGEVFTSLAFSRRSSRLRTARSSNCSKRWLSSRNT